MWSPLPCECLAYPPWASCVEGRRLFGSCSALVQWTQCFINWGGTSASVISKSSVMNLPSNPAKLTTQGLLCLSKSVAGERKGSEARSTSVWLHTLHGTGESVCKARSLASMSSKTIQNQLIIHGNGTATHRTPLAEGTGCRSSGEQHLAITVTKKALQVRIVQSGRLDCISSVESWKGATMGLLTR